MGNIRTLTPFTKGDPRAIAAGRKSAESRRAKREAGQLVKVVDADAGAEVISTLITRYERSNLSSAAAAATQHLIARLGSGEIPIKDGTDAANVIKVLFDLTRLEEGQSTSNVLHGTIDSAAIVARIEELRADLTPALPTSDVTA